MPNITGPQTLGDGSSALARGGHTGEAIVAAAHGVYHEPVSRGAVFNGAIAGQVTTVGLATTYTGLVLSNPITSQVYLSLLQAGYNAIVAFAAGASIGLFTGYNLTTNVTHTAPVTPRNQKFVGAAGSGTGLLDSSATLPTAPTLNTVFGAGLTGAITTTPMGLSGLINIDGLILLPPGAYVGFYTSTASGTAGMALSLTWEEIASVNI